MQHHLMTHRHAVADGEGRPWISMQHRAVLYVASASNHNRIIPIASDHGMEPDTRIHPNHNVPNHRRCRCHPGTLPERRSKRRFSLEVETCLLYTSDAADEEDSVDLGGRRIIKKKKNNRENNKGKKTQIK
eukprot:TRINITY_DN44020_c0_g1_i2.p1 TRINITY_DN44020_c0_g1~~TRINITY_DN44020_c0_g1_i2.p1  ORF type:complete len:131 (-),score=20.44 TRINITY_DN44020_c0_g1_i2:25-417(-)